MSNVVYLFERYIFLLYFSMRLCFFDFVRKTPKSEMQICGIVAEKTKQYDGE